MGISLQKEEPREIVYHRTLLGYCWDGREENEDQQRREAEWRFERQQIEDALIQAYDHHMAAALRNRIKKKVKHHHHKNNTNALPPLPPHTTNITQNEEKELKRKKRSEKISTILTKLGKRKEFLAQRGKFLKKKNNNNSSQVVVVRAGKTSSSSSSTSASTSSGKSNPIGGGGGERNDVSPTTATSSTSTRHNNSTSSCNEGPLGLLHKKEGSECVEGEKEGGKKKTKEKQGGREEERGGRGDTQLGDKMASASWFPPPPPFPSPTSLSQATATIHPSQWMATSPSTMRLQTKKICFSLPQLLVEVEKGSGWNEPPSSSSSFKSEGDEEGGPAAAAEQEKEEDGDGDGVVVEEMRRKEGDRSFDFSVGDHGDLEGGKMVEKCGGGGGSTSLYHRRHPPPPYAYGRNGEHSFHRRGGTGLPGSSDYHKGNGGTTEEVPQSPHRESPPFPIPTSYSSFGGSPLRQNSKREKKKSLPTIRFMPPDSEGSSLGNKSPSHSITSSSSCSSFSNSGVSSSNICPSSTTSSNPIMMPSSPHLRHPYSPPGAGKGLDPSQSFYYRNSISLPGANSATTTASVAPHDSALPPPLSSSSSSTPPPPSLLPAAAASSSVLLVPPSSSLSHRHSCASLLDTRPLKYTFSSSWPPGVAGGGGGGVTDGSTRPPILLPGHSTVIRGRQNRGAPSALGVVDTAGGKATSAGGGVVRGSTSLKKEKEENNVGERPDGGDGGGAGEKEEEGGGGAVERERVGKASPSVPLFPPAPVVVGGGGPTSSTVMLKQDREKKIAAAALAALKKVKKDTNHYNHFNVVVYNHTHTYLRRYAMGVLKDVCFQLAPANRRYDQAVLKGFPYYFLPSIPVSLEGLDRKKNPPHPRHDLFPSPHHHLHTGGRRRSFTGDSETSSGSFSGSGGSGWWRKGRKKNGVPFQPPLPLQPLDAHCLTASLLFASNGGDALIHAHRLASLFTTRKSLSYPLLDQDVPPSSYRHTFLQSSHPQYNNGDAAISGSRRRLLPPPPLFRNTNNHNDNKASSEHTKIMVPPVVVFSVSALELLLLPREAEVCFGGWCHVSLEDERFRVIELVHDYVERFSETYATTTPTSSTTARGGGGRVSSPASSSNSTHLPFPTALRKGVEGGEKLVLVEGGGERAEGELEKKWLEALHVPWATDLNDFYRREEALREKRHCVQQLKNCHIHAREILPLLSPTSSVGKDGNDGSRAFSTSSSSGPPGAAAAATPHASTRDVKDPKGTSSHHADQQDEGGGGAGAEVRMMGEKESGAERSQHSSPSSTHFPFRFPSPQHHHTNPSARRSTRGTQRSLHDQEELWFPMAFLVVAIPLYQCSILPTTFHQYTTRSSAISLHVQHPMSRKMFGVGCITGVRYGGVMVVEHRGRISPEDVVWLSHFLSLVPPQDPQHAQFREAQNGHASEGGGGGGGGSGAGKQVEKVGVESERKKKEKKREKSNVKVVFDVDVIDGRKEERKPAPLSFSLPPQEKGNDGKKNARGNEKKHAKSGEKGRKSEGKEGKKKEEVETKGDERKQEEEEEEEVKKNLRTGSSPLLSDSSGSPSFLSRRKNTSKDGDEEGEGGGVTQRATQIVFTSSHNNTAPLPYPSFTPTKAVSMLDPDLLSPPPVSSSQYARRSLSEQGRGKGGGSGGGAGAGVDGDRNGKDEIKENRGDRQHSIRSPGGFLPLPSKREWGERREGNMRERGGGGRGTRREGGGGGGNNNNNNGNSSPWSWRRKSSPKMLNKEEQCIVVYQKVFFPVWKKLLLIRKAIQQKLESQGLQVVEAHTRIAARMFHRRLLIHQKYLAAPRAPLFPFSAPEGKGGVGGSKVDEKKKEAKKERGTTGELVEMDSMDFPSFSLWGEEASSSPNKGTKEEEEKRGRAKKEEEDEQEGRRRGRRRRGGGGPSKTIKSEGSISPFSFTSSSSSSSSSSYFEKKMKRGPSDWGSTLLFNMKRKSAPAPFGGDEEIRKNNTSNSRCRSYGPSSRHPPPLLQEEDGHHPESPYAIADPKRRNTAWTPPRPPYFSSHSPRIGGGGSTERWRPPERSLSLSSAASSSCSENSDWIHRRFTRASGGGREGERRRYSTLPPPPQHHSDCHSPLSPQSFGPKKKRQNLLQDASPKRGTARGGEEEKEENDESKRKRMKNLPIQQQGNITTTALKKKKTKSSSLTDWLPTPNYIPPLFGEKKKDDRKGNLKKKIKEGIYEEEEEEEDDDEGRTAWWEEYAGFLHYGEGGRRGGGRQRQRRRVETNSILVRGAIRQIGGNNYLNMDAAMKEGVQLGVLATAISSWATNLIHTSPIRARPLSLYLQRYEGISNAIRVSVPEILLPPPSPFKENNYMNPGGGGGGLMMRGGRSSFIGSFRVTAGGTASVDAGLVAGGGSWMGGNLSLVGSFRATAPAFPPTMGNASLTRELSIAPTSLPPPLGSASHESGGGGGTAAAAVGWAPTSRQWSTAMAGVGGVEGGMRVASPLGPPISNFSFYAPSSPPGMVGGEGGGRVGGGGNSSSGGAAAGAFPVPGFSADGVVDPVGGGGVSMPVLQEAGAAGGGGAVTVTAHRGLPFITFYTGPLDPTVEPDLPEPLENLFRLYHLFDSYSSPFLLTERRTLFLQQFFHPTRGLHRAESSVDMGATPVSSPLFLLSAPAPDGAVSQVVVHPSRPFPLSSISGAARERHPKDGKTPSGRTPTGKEMMLGSEVFLSSSSSSSVFSSFHSPLLELKEAEELGEEVERKQAERTLMVLQQELRDIQTLRERAQREAMDRFGEYQRVARLFLPHTRVERVPGQLLFLKMLRIFGGNSTQGQVPVPELNQDWLSMLIGLLVVPFADIFSSFFYFLNETGTTTTKKKEGEVVREEGGEREEKTEQPHGNGHKEAECKNSGHGANGELPHSPPCLQHHHYDCPLEENGDGERGKALSHVQRSRCVVTRYATYFPEFTMTISGCGGGGAMSCVNPDTATNRNRQEPMVSAGVLNGHRHPNIAATSSSTFPVSSAPRMFSYQVLSPSPQVLQQIQHPRGVEEIVLAPVPLKLMRGGAGGSGGGGGGGGGGTTMDMEDKGGNFSFMTFPSGYDSFAQPYFGPRAPPSVGSSPPFPVPSCASDLLFGSSAGGGGPGVPPSNGSFAFPTFATSVEDLSSPAKLPVVHLLTGGSLGVLAGVFMLYADTIRQRAVALFERSDEEDENHNAPSIMAEEDDEGVEGVYVRRGGSGGKKISSSSSSRPPHFDAWIASGEQVLLRRLVLWGVRGGDKGKKSSHRGGSVASLFCSNAAFHSPSSFSSAFSCCVEGGGTAMKNAPHKRKGSRHISGEEEGRVEEEDDVDEEEVKRRRQQHDLFSPHFSTFSGAPFSTSEILALFDAISYYLRTLRELRFLYGPAAMRRRRQERLRQWWEKEKKQRQQQQEDEEDEIRLGRKGNKRVSSVVFVPAPAKKKVSFLQRLFGTQGEEEKTEREKKKAAQVEEKYLSPPPSPSQPLTARQSPGGIFRPLEIPPREKKKEKEEEKKRKKLATPPAALVVLGKKGGMGGGAVPGSSSTSSAQWKSEKKTTNNGVSVSLPSQSSLSALVLTTPSPASSLEAPSTILSLTKEKSERSGSDDGVKSLSPPPPPPTIFGHRPLPLCDHSFLGTRERRLHRREIRRRQSRREQRQEDRRQRCLSFLSACRWSSASSHYRSSPLHHHRDVNKREEEELLQSWWDREEAAEAEADKREALEEVQKEYLFHPPSSVISSFELCVGTHFYYKERLTRSSPWNMDDLEEEEEEEEEDSRAVSRSNTVTTRFDTQGFTDEVIPIPIIASTPASVLRSGSVSTSGRERRKTRTLAQELEDDGEVGGRSGRSRNSMSSRGSYKRKDSSKTTTTTMMMMMTKKNKSPNKKKEKAKQKKNKKRKRKPDNLTEWEKKEWKMWKKRLELERPYVGGEEQKPPKKHDENSFEYHGKELFRLLEKTLVQWKAEEKKRRAAASLHAEEGAGHSSGNSSPLRSPFVSGVFRFRGGREKESGGGGSISSSSSSSSTGEVGTGIFRSVSVGQRSTMSRGNGGGALPEWENQEDIEKIIRITRV